MNLTTKYHYIGIFLAVCSTFLIGISFILKKISLIKLNQKGYVRASAGGYGYLKDWVWWFGILSMAAGEMLNFAAFAFAPASVVTPLGGLTVIVTAILASKFLDENLNPLGRAGCLLCILGSTIIIIHAPKEGQVKTFKEFILKIQEPLFVNYVVLVLLISVIIVLFIAPRYGDKHITVYITLCSAVGSLIVMVTKGIGIALRTIDFSTFEDDLLLWLIVLISFLILCIVFQINYLNKALDIYSTNIVTPIYYVSFTTLVIVESAVLFKEWEAMSNSDVLSTLCGFSIVVQAIYILKEFN